MKTITYQELNHENFNEHSMDDFIRHQNVTESWRMIDGEMVLKPTVFVQDWSLEKRQQTAKDIVEGFDSKTISGFGAFDDGKYIGHAVLETRIFGSTASYMELTLFHLSEPYRGKGIGKKLFTLAADKARELGAEKLFISCFPAKETIAVYTALGCVPCKEHNTKKAAEEPLDIQLEYIL